MILECPYTEDTNVLTGIEASCGRKIVNVGRQSHRFSDHNFEDNAKDGHGNDWPYSL
jgi:hypothetical protein